MFDLHNIQTHPRQNPEHCVSNDILYSMHLYYEMCTQLSSVWFLFGYFVILHRSLLAPPPSVRSEIWVYEVSNMPHFSVN